MRGGVGACVRVWVRACESGGVRVPSMISPPPP